MPLGGQDLLTNWDRLMAHLLVLGLPGFVQSKQTASGKARMGLLPLARSGAGLRSFPGARGTVGVRQELACIHGGFPFRSGRKTRDAFMKPRDML